MTSTRITHSEEWIDPNAAAFYLAANTHNRHVRPRRVAQYASDLTAGRWALNGETIKFDRNGQLVDGQHRLAAVVESGIAMHTLVVRGLEPQAQETVDSGSARTAGDVLGLRGMENASSVAAIARMVYRWDHGVRHQVGGVSITAAEASTSALTALIDSDPTIQEASTVARRLGKVGLQPRAVGLCFVLFSRISYLDARDFFDRLDSGANLANGSPLLALRRWGNQNMTLASSRLSNRAARISSREEHAESVAAIIKTWNAWRGGKELRRIRVALGGANAETFPEPR
jgi:hypothetical protein